MLRIIGDDIWRGRDKIGWIEGNDVYSSAGGRKVGYCTSNDIYDANGRKIGYVENSYIRAVGGESIRLEENRRQVNGGSASDLMRAAIRLLLGE